MFEKIQHIGYLVDDLEKAVAWFKDRFGAERAGGGLVQSSRAVPSAGRNAFVHFGQVEVELIEPQDPGTMGAHHAMDHVGYVTRDISAAITECCRRGFPFAADAPNTNAIGQQVLYFDPHTSMRSRMHLTQLPA
jgi:catechol 2,3-dioxygenase-like lactoylglutathione lyase family enzyme